MTNPMQFDPDRLRVALDNGEVVELDGGTLMLGGEESPSLLLRLAPWRARSVARVLEEWSAVSRVFHRAPRPILTRSWSSPARWTLLHPRSATPSRSRSCCGVIVSYRVVSG
jgi:hypothetical protein